MGERVRRVLKVGCKSFATVIMVSTIQQIWPSFIMHIPGGGERSVGEIGIGGGILESGDKRASFFLDFSENDIATLS
jgi:hypothetical protein